MVSIWYSAWWWVAQFVCGYRNYLAAWHIEYQPNVNLLLQVPTHKEGAFVVEV
jgi:hypothetical protein